MLLLPKNSSVDKFDIYGAFDAVNKFFLSSTSAGRKQITASTEPVWRTGRRLRRSCDITEKPPYFDNSDLQKRRFYDLNPIGRLSVSNEKTVRRTGNIERIFSYSKPLLTLCALLFLSAILGFFIDILYPC